MLGQPQAAAGQLKADHLSAGGIAPQKPQVNEGGAVILFLAQGQRFLFKLFAKPACIGFAQQEKQRIRPTVALFKVFARLCEKLLTQSGAVVLDEGRLGASKEPGLVDALRLEKSTGQGGVAVLHSSEALQSCGMQIAIAMPQLTNQGLGQRCTVP